MFRRAANEWDWGRMPKHPTTQRYEGTRPVSGASTGSSAWQQYRQGEREVPWKPAKPAASPSAWQQYRQGEWQTPWTTPKPNKPATTTTPAQPVWDGEFQVVPSGSNKPPTGGGSTKPASPGNATSVRPGTNAPTAEADSDTLQLTQDEIDLVTQGSVTTLYEQYLNFITTQGWDEDNDGRVDQAVLNLFGEVAGNSLASWMSLLPDAPNANFSAFTVEWLQNFFGNAVEIDKNDSLAMAEGIIQTLQGRAEELGIDLGDIGGKSAEEVLSIFLAKLEELQSQQAQSGYVPPNLPTSEELGAEINYYQGLQHTFGVSPEINAEVMAWVGQNFAETNVDPSNPQQVEAAVRSYLFSEIYRSGYYIDPDVLASLTLQELTQLLQSINNTQASYYQGQMATIWDEAEQAQQGAYPHDPWVSVADALDVPLPLVVPTHPEYESVSAHLIALHYDITRTQGLLDAFDANAVYQPPPDLTLLVMIAGMVIDPIDWAASGWDILGYLGKGQIDAAVGTFILAVVPIVAGHMVSKLDNWIHKGNEIVIEVERFDVFNYQRNFDDLPPGGGLGSAADDAANLVTGSSQAIEAAELGIKGAVEEFDATFRIADNVAYIHIDMIQGDVTNPFEVFNNMRQYALAQGATTLRISGTLANPELMDILKRRYGLITEGGIDYIQVILKES